MQIGELRDRLGGLPSPGEADGIWRGIWLEEAHHSTAIEGNTLVLKQVEQLLEEGRAVGNKELSEYMEVRGYADAANWVYGQALDPGAWSSGELLSLTELRHIHRLALTPAGMLRRIRTPVTASIPAHSASTTSSRSQAACAPPVARGLSHDHRLDRRSASAGPGG